MNTLENYKVELKRSIFGAKARAFVFGYGSKSLENYLEFSRKKLWNLESKAKDEKEIKTKEIEKLEILLFGIEVDRTLYLLGYNPRF